MSAASFLIVTTKLHLCHWWLITWSVVSSGLGIIIGLEAELSPFVVNVVFSTYITCFALSFSYRCYILVVPAAAPSKDSPPPSSPVEVCTPGMAIALLVSLNMAGVLGGFLTAQTGSGADVMAYTFGTFAWN